MGVNGNGVRAAKWAAFAAVFVGIVGNTTVYLDGRAARAEVRNQTKQIAEDARKARSERRADENQFFRSQCFRDGVFARVITQALRDAQDRVRASISDPSQRDIELTKLQRTIDQLEILSNSCMASIPDLKE